MVIFISHMYDMIRSAKLELQMSMFLIVKYKLLELMILIEDLVILNVVDLTFFSQS